MRGMIEMEMLTLYTCDSGYELFKAGYDFTASTEEQEEYNYVVESPIANLEEVDIEDGLSCYGVIDLNGVTVTSRELVQSN